MTAFPNVTLDGLQLLFRTEGGPVDVDAAGVEWLLTKFDGWTGTPAPRTARTDRPGHAGSFRAAGYRGPRIVNMDWTATGPSPETMRAVESQVAAVCSDAARLYEMIVTESGFSRAVMVELDDAILATPLRWNATSFSARLAMPDPRKHDTAWQTPVVNMGTPPIGGADMSSPGASMTAPGLDMGTPGVPSVVTVHNSGTARARPIFAVTGPITKPQIIDVTTGITLSYTGVLGPTDVLTINTDEFPVQGFPRHGVYLNNTNNQRPALLTPNGWPTVLPGMTAVYNLRATAFSAASMTVSLRSAWH